MPGQIHTVVHQTSGDKSGNNLKKCAFQEIS